MEDLVVVGKKIIPQSTRDSYESLCLNRIEERATKEKKPQELLITQTLDLEILEKDLSKDDEDDLKNL